MGLKKIVMTAQWRGSANVLKPVAEELIRRGHAVDIYASGNQAEAAGFDPLPYTMLDRQNISRIVQEAGVVVTGLADHGGPDTLFLREANRFRVPSIGALDQGSRIIQRFGSNSMDWPHAVAVPDTTAQAAVEDSLGTDILGRSTVVGWVAFDGLAAKRDSFTPLDRERILTSICVDPLREWSLYCSQNTWHTPKNEADYTTEEKAGVSYEIRVTQRVFSASRAHSIPLLVKPHPKELKQDVRYTENMAKKYGVLYIPPSACSTQDLMLACRAVATPLSASMNEACLLDRNTAAMLPDKKYEEFAAYPALMAEAIQYATHWSNIGPIWESANTTRPEELEILAKRRKKFSVDGKAAQRFADLVETYAQ